MNKPVAWMLVDEINGDYMLERHPSGDYAWIPLYTHPVKELHLSLQKNKETGELFAVTYTDDEHRIVEVLWQRPPVKELTDDVAKHHYNKGHEDGRKLATVKELTNEEYAGIGLHLFRIGEATSIKEGIRLVKLVVELTNIRKAQEK